MQAVTAWNGGDGDRDLNWLGQTVAGAIWFLNNVRIRVVGVFISGLMMLMLAAGLASSLYSGMKVGEIHEHWRAFDTGAATKQTLLAELRDRLGFGGLIHHVHDYVLDRHKTDSLRLAREALLRVRGVAAAWTQAGVTAEEAAALKDIVTMVAAYEAVLDKVQAGKGGAALEATLRIDGHPAIAALETLGGILRHAQHAAEHQVEDAFARMRAAIFGGLAVNTVLLLLLAVFFYWFTRWRIVRTLHQLDHTMARLAQGDLAVTVPLVEKRDELGDMARAVEVFKKNAIQNEQLNAEKQADQKREAERARRRESLTLSFGGNVDGVLRALAGSSNKMRETAQAMAAIAEQTATQAARAMSAAQSGAHNVETVAAATTQLAGSIAEIGRQVDQSARIAEDAVCQASHVNERVRGLSEVSNRIGEVTDVISKIAEQTNLLALNASIEATRAGEAGKGFLVVANAVKNLARQTTEATEDIRCQIEAIQKATEETVEAIQGIGGTIHEINAITTTVAAAVEEQSAATDEIARNALGAAEMSKEVHLNVAGVSDAAQSTGIFAHEVLEAAENLSRQADKLGGDVSGFLAEVKAV